MARLEDLNVPQPSDDIGFAASAAMADQVYGVRNQPTTPAEVGAEPTHLDFTGSNIYDSVFPRSPAPDLPSPTPTPEPVPHTQEKDPTDNNKPTGEQPAQPANQA